LKRLPGEQAGSGTRGTELTCPDILTYHKIGSQFELGITSVTMSRFRRHLDLVSGAGKRFANASDLVFDGADGNAVSLTFDDGYECVYTHALPEMAGRGITGTIFPVVGAVGGENRWDVRLSLKRFKHLSWDQLASLARAGFEIGSHTMSHRDLTRLGIPALRNELKDSKREIEDRLGIGVRAVAFPFGRYNHRVISESVEAGYSCGFGSSPNGSGSVMTVGRMGVHVMDGEGAVSRMLGLSPGRRFEILKSRLIARLALVTTVIKR
jgi:peptidoglycan/xylan/chitin deacetylase (PgdA/CDA1 family)